MNDDGLDTAVKCVRELSEISRNVAGFDAEWSRAAGELVQKRKLYERRYRAALWARAGEDFKVAEKDAMAHIAVEDSDPGLAERIEELEGTVEQFKTRFKALELRASTTQSRLSAHRDMERLGEYVHRQ